MMVSSMLFRPFVLTLFVSDFNSVKSFSKIWSGSSKHHWPILPSTPLYPLQEPGCRILFGIPKNADALCQISTRRKVVHHPWPHQKSIVRNHIWNFSDAFFESPPIFGDTARCRFLFENLWFTELEEMPALEGIHDLETLLHVFLSSSDVHLSNKTDPSSIGALRGVHHVVFYSPLNLLRQKIIVLKFGAL